MICLAGHDVVAAVFPEAGLISLLLPMDPELLPEIALLGPEGMFGIALPFGIVVSSISAVVRNDSTVLAIDQRSFRTVLARCPMLAMRVHRYGYRLLTQVARTTACNTVHAIEARTARWMLLMSDRVNDDAFKMTQVMLASLLCVQRSAISHAASALADAGLVRYSRGTMQVVDREGLEAVACSCYAILENGYRSTLHKH